MNNQFGLAELVIILFMLLVFVGMIVIYWRIISKTGNTGALSLLLLVPIVNIIFLIWLAFSEWPVEKRVKDLENQQSGFPRV